MISDIYNLKNEKVGTIELPVSIFSVKWNPELVKFAFEVQRANSRSPIAHVKDRSEVSGGGKKPWKQKGTGRARHGSNRSPIWVGGGVIHGPTAERSYVQKINRRQKQGALFSLLSKRLTDGKLMVFDSLPQDGKTKSVASFLLKNFSKSRPSAVLVAGREHKAGLSRGARNISGLITTSPSSLNVYDLSSRRRILMEQSALPDFTALVKVKN